MQRGSARVTVHAGSDVIASASVVDNTTNDPTTIPALTLAEQAITIMLPGNVPLVLRRIPGGTFMMGSPESERGRSADGREGPHHPVTLTQDYYLGEFEVTQEQWLALMGTNPSLMAACGLDCPVEQVSWDDICGGTTGSECLQTSFIGTLNAHLTATGQPGAGKFRLPTEAEWERAARAGTTTEFSFPAPPDWHLECGDFPAGDAHMWWCGNQPPYGTKQVGQKQPNAFGLYDMHGNVLEWVADWYGSYSSGGATDPTGPPTAMYRVARGGGFEHWAWLCRSAFRDPSPANNRNYILGFRLARSQ
jgi:formylglycine-generating enzyme required for sulfatase activity